MKDRATGEPSTMSAVETPGSLLPERQAPVPHVAGRLVVLCHTGPIPRIVHTSIEQIRDNGGRVVLLGPLVRGVDASAPADEVIVLRQRAAPVYVDKANPPRRYSRQWVSIVARNLTRRATFKPARRVLGASTMWWLAALHNRAALSALDSADVITALDAGAVYMVWEASRRNRAAAAVNGIGPTMEHLGLAR